MSAAGAVMTSWRSWPEPDTTLTWVHSNVQGFRRWLSSGFKALVDWQKCINVSDILTAPVTGAISGRPDDGGVRTSKTFVLNAVKISNPTLVFYGIFEFARYIWVYPAANFPTR